MASTGVHGVNSLVENDHVISRKAVKSFESQASGVGRKSLQTLQYSSCRDKHLVSKDGAVKQKVSKSGGKAVKKRSMIKQLHKPVEVFCDPNPETPIHSSPEAPIHSSPNTDDEAFQLMANESIPESYWKMLAEERRAALDDSLHENEQLHQEIESLKEENSKLSDLADQAEQLATILQTAVGDSSNDERDKVHEDDADHDDNNDIIHSEDAVQNKSELHADDSRHSVESDTSYDQEKEIFLSSYDVISLTDENPPTLSSDDEDDSDKRAQGVKSDSTCEPESKHLSPAQVAENNLESSKPETSPLTPKMSNSGELKSGSPVIQND